MKDLVATRTLALVPIMLGACDSIAADSPQANERIAFTCGMGMYRGAVVESR